MTQTVAERLFRNYLLRNRRRATHALLAFGRRPEPAVHEPRQRVHEHLALLAGELAEDLLLHAVRDLAPAGDDLLALRGDGDDAGAAVVRRRAALGQAAALELVDGRDHRG